MIFLRLSIVPSHGIQYVNDTFPDQGKSRESVGRKSTGLRSTLAEYEYMIFPLHDLPGVPVAVAPRRIVVTNIGVPHGPSIRQLTSERNPTHA